MKTLYFYITLSIFIIRPVLAQLEYATINQGELKLKTKPRYALDLGMPFNIVGPYAPIISESAYIESGIFITNNGFTYQEGDRKFIHRTIGLCVPVRTGKIINKKIYIGVGNQFNFPFHYKLKTYDKGTWKNKNIEISDFLSKRVSHFYPCAEISAGISYHGVGRFSLRFLFFYGDFFNTEFTEDVDGFQVQPYKDMIIQPHWGINFAYNPGL